MYFQKIRYINNNFKHDSLHFLTAQDGVEFIGKIIDDNFKVDQLLGDFVWQQSDWLEIIGKREYLLINLYKEEKIIGILLSQIILQEELAHLLKIVVDKNQRNKKYGRVMMELFKKNLVNLGIKKIYLEVEENNASAISFYEKNDINKLNLQKRFYSNGRNAWKMSGEVLKKY